jgi:hypothetical protein
MESTYFGYTYPFFADTLILANIADVNKRGNGVLDLMYKRLDAFCHGVNLQCLRSVPVAVISEVIIHITFYMFLFMYTYK